MAKSYFYPMVSGLSWNRNSLVLRASENLCNVSGYTFIIAKHFLKPPTFYYHFYLVDFWPGNISAFLELLQRKQNYLKSFKKNKIVISMHVFLPDTISCSVMYLISSSLLRSISLKM